MAHDFKRFPELANSQMAFYYFDSPHKQITENFSAKVVKVHDGDTITVQWDERDFTFPIRFLNTNSPELNEEGGDESQKWLESILLGEDIDVLINPKQRVGKWGRILGTIIHGGVDINQLSITFGFATSFENRNAGKILNINELIPSI